MVSDMPIMDRDERRVLRFRRHWASMVWNFTRATAIVVVLKMLIWMLHAIIGPAAWAVETALWFASFGVLVWLVGRIVLWWVDVVVFTDKRFIRKYGIIRIRTDWAPLPKITDMATMRSPLGRIFGYGSMLSETAGKDSLKVIHYIPDPDLVDRVIARLKFGHSDD